MFGDVFEYLLEYVFRDKFGDVLGGVFEGVVEDVFEDVFEYPVADIFKSVFCCSTFIVLHPWLYCPQL